MLSAAVFVVLVIACANVANLSLSRAATRVEGLDVQAARDRVRERVPDADPADVALFDDLLGIAGVLAGKKAAPPGPGTLPTNGPLFSALLVGVIVIVGALTFFPALSLSPIVEHFIAQFGKVF